MNLYAKKNGKGYITTYQIIFGCREAKDLKLIDEKRNSERNRKC